MGVRPGKLFPDPPLNPLPWVKVFKFLYLFVRHTVLSFNYSKEPTAAGARRGPVSCFISVSTESSNLFQNLTGGHR
jgi:hypothetical protein